MQTLENPMPEHEHTTIRSLAGTVMLTKGFKVLVETPTILVLCRKGWTVCKSLPNTIG
jgi:hypothetical protein